MSKVSFKQSDNLKIEILVVLVVVVVVVMGLGIVEFIACVLSWSRYLFITNEKTTSNVTSLAWPYVHAFLSPPKKGKYLTLLICAKKIK